MTGTPGALAVLGVLRFGAVGGREGADVVSKARLRSGRGLTAELGLVRALRALDVDGKRDAIEAGLVRCDAMLVKSQAFSIEPFIAEERARLASALGANDAEEKLREALRIYHAQQATGHAARLEAELERGFA